MDRTGRKAVRRMVSAAAVVIFMKIAPEGQTMAMTAAGSLLLYEMTNLMLWAAGWEIRDRREKKYAGYQIRGKERYSA